MCPACSDGSLPAGWASFVTTPPSGDCSVRLLLNDHTTATAMVVGGEVQDESGNAVDLTNVIGWRVRV